MRSIHIPVEWIRAAHIDSGKLGARIEYPVAVDWPELRLTEGQTIVNAVARAYGLPEPFEDHSIFSVTIDRFR
jgi:hypothetical protein